MLLDGGIVVEQQLLPVCAEAIDLLDTLRANRGVCVGMAANMIGGRKNIIAFCVGPGETVMMNPEITRKSRNGAGNSRK